MRRVRVQVTPALLIGLGGMFPFPFGTELVSAAVVDNGNLEITLEHDGLPDVPSDQEPPLVKPTFQRVDFVGWGLP
jgi:hypothetical protein